MNSIIIPLWLIFHEVRAKVWGLEPINGISYRQMMSNAGVHELNDDTSLSGWVLFGRWGLFFRIS